MEPKKIDELLEKTVGKPLEKLVGPHPMDLLIQEMGFAEARKASPLVFVSSPYAASGRLTVTDHERYAREAMMDCFKRGEVPFASHLLYTQPGVLDDKLPEERVRGIKAGHEVMRWCRLVAVYADLGTSSGMQGDIVKASQLGIKVEFRSLRAPTP